MYRKTTVDTTATVDIILSRMLLDRKRRKRISSEKALKWLVTRLNLSIKATQKVLD